MLFELGTGKGAKIKKLMSALLEDFVVSVSEPEKRGDRISVRFMEADESGPIEVPVIPVKLG